MKLKPASPRCVCAYTGNKGGTSRNLPAPMSTVIRLDPIARARVTSRHGHPRPGHGMANEGRRLHAHLQGVQLPIELVDSDCLRENCAAASGVRR